MVAFQLPNWREAVVAFYGLAMGGYVLVPIVHIYGSKEVRFILDESGARAYISADRYGHVDYLDIVDGAGRDELPDLRLHVVVGAARCGAPKAGVRRVGWDVVDDAAPRGAPRRRRPRRRVRARVHVGNDERPEGCDAQPSHVARGAGCTSTAGSRRARPISWARRSRTRRACSARCSRPWRWARTSTSSTSGIRRVCSTIMLEADVGAGTGASVFLSSVIDHPDVLVRARAADPARRFGRRSGSARARRARRRARHRAHSGVRIDGTPVDHRRHVRRSGRQAPRHRWHPMLGVEIQLVDDDGAPVGAGEAGRSGHAAPTSASATPIPHSTRTRSTQTGGSAPATWVCSMPTGFSPSPTA